MKQDRNVVITGGSAGVGLATALEFARRGSAVAIVARGQERLDSARREIEEIGARCVALSADVGDAAALDAAAAEVEESLGPIDVWVNNAMATVFSPFDEITPEEFARVTQVTYLGFVHGTMSALRRMRQRDSGVIVQVGSALAYRSIPLQAAYCGAKHAIVGFTDSLRSELIHDGSSVQVTVVHLPAVNTPQFVWARTHIARHPQPLPPIYQPEVAADAIVWAAEHPRREYLVGSSTAMGVLSSKLFPGMGDRYLATEGYESQMSDLPFDPGRPDNLFAPPDWIAGAHGPFDGGARTESWQQRLLERSPLPGVVELMGGAWAGIRRLPAMLTGR